MKRALLVAGMVLLTFLGVTTEASATANSVAIYNSENSAANMGIATNTSYNTGYAYQFITPTGSLYWSPEGLLNRTNPNPAHDAIGYYIGPGYCARIYDALSTNQWFQTWNYVDSVGPGTHYLWGTPNTTLIGVENHPAVYGGAHGCGMSY